MKTIRRGLPLTALLLCTGCVSTEWDLQARFGLGAPPALKAAPVVEEPAKPIAADQVTPNNARQMAEALEKELDQADAAPGSENK